jgi:hypothetical protein
MAKTVIDLTGNTVKADAFVGSVAPEDIPATAVDVAAIASGGVTAGDLQAVLKGIADRVKALEDA